MSNDVEHPLSPKMWVEKVLHADNILAEINALLQAHDITLPTTPRCPDVRAILNNNTGDDVYFLNPAGHAGDKHEHIPSEGDKTAIMVMFNGNTAVEQSANANSLFERYPLASEGITQEFLDDLKAGKLDDIIREAYGPAPFGEQVERLVNVDWELQDGNLAVLTPEKGDNGAYGVREPVEETVFCADFKLAIQGTDTSAEYIEGPHLCVAVSEDWETGEIKTRPIVPSVAREFYGAHFTDIPHVTMTIDGTVGDIQFADGTIITSDAKQVATSSDSVSPDGYGLPNLAR